MRQTTPFRCVSSMRKTAPLISRQLLLSIAARLSSYNKPHGMERPLWYICLGTMSSKQSITNCPALQGYVRACTATPRKAQWLSPMKPDRKVIRHPARWRLWQPTTTGLRQLGGQLPKAKFYNNVIWRPILPIPISHVIIPILHSDLGIFTWLYEALMKDLQELDAQLAAKCEPLTAADATAFQKLCELNGQLQSEKLAANTVQAQREGIVQQLQFVALHLQQHPEQHVMEVINDLQQAYRAADQQLQQHNVHIARLQQDVMKASGSKDLKGPCSSAIEPVLQQYKIERQVYHGSAFIGNHVHRALKPTVVTAICRSHIPVIEGRCASLLPAANRIACQYEKLLNGYAACRAIFSHCESIGDESLERLQSEIEEFLKTC